MFVALLIAQRFLLKLRQALALRLSVGQTLNIIALVAITRNEMFSYVSPCYGGRASNKFIFNNCAFVSWLEPNDQVRADMGFKVKEDLMVVQARLAIPPSTCGNLAMSSGDAYETSKIANIRIYVEDVIGRLKHFVS